MRFRMAQMPIVRSADRRNFGIYTTATAAMTRGMKLSEPSTERARHCRRTRTASGRLTTVQFPP